MKILLQADCAPEGRVQFALIDVDAAFFTKILHRNSLFSHIRSCDEDAWEVSFWGIPGDFYERPLVEDVFDKQAIKNFERKGYLVLANDFVFPDAEDVSPVRSECGRVILDGEGFRFRAILKHTDIYLNSARIKFEDVPDLVRRASEGAKS